MRSEFFNSYMCPLQLVIFFSSGIHPSANCQKASSRFFRLNESMYKWNLDITFLWGSKFFNVTLKLTLYRGWNTWASMGRARIFSTLYREKTLKRGMLLYRGFPVYSREVYFCSFSGYNLKNKFTPNSEHSNSHYSTIIYVHSELRNEPRLEEIEILVVCNSAGSCAFMFYGWLVFWRTISSSTHEIVPRRFWYLCIFRYDIHDRSGSVRPRLCLIFVFFFFYACIKKDCMSGWVRFRMTFL